MFSPTQITKTHRMGKIFSLKLKSKLMREKPYNAFIKLKHTEATDMISFVFMFKNLLAFLMSIKIASLNVCLFQEHLIF